MTDPSDQPGGGRDLDELAGHAERLTVAIEAAIPGWAERSVLRVADAWRPGRSGELAAEAAQAGREALEDVGPRVRRLLESDVEAQATGPLEICRSAVRHPTRVLAEDRPSAATGSGSALVVVVVVVDEDVVPGPVGPVGVVVGPAVSTTRSRTVRNSVAPVPVRAETVIE